MAVETLPIGGEFQVNTYTDNDQINPSVTALNDGGFVVTWGSRGQDGSASGIFGQRYAADGSTLGEEFQVNTYTESDQSYPSITALNDGGFVVTWRSWRQVDIQQGIFGQRYAADGSTVGDEFQVNTYTDGGAAPFVTGLRDGGFVVTWSSEGPGPEDKYVFGQRYAADGSTVGEDFQVNTYTGLLIFPSVTALNDGGFVVTWASDGQDGSNFGIFGQRYTADGSTLGEEFQVNTYTYGDQSFPSSTALNDHGFVVTWADWGRDGSGFGIFGQRYAADGSTVGDEFQVNTYIADRQEAPSLTGLSDGGFVVTWLSYGQDGSDQGIFGQRYTADGSTVGEEFQVNTYTENDQSFPSVAGLSDGGFVVTWYSTGQDGSDRGIYAQRFLSNNLPEGDIVIDGAAKQGETLTVDISNVTDSDGVDTDTVSYQWQRDGIAIAGETELTYTLVQDDVGSEISFSLSFTDSTDIDETVISAATAPVENVNDAPTGEVIVTGTATQGRVLTSDISTLEDVDGIETSTISYQWLRNGQAISSDGNNASYTLKQADVGSEISLRVAYTDGQGTDESVTSDATRAVLNVNDAPEGMLQISGNATERSTLSADMSGVSDKDGIDEGTLSYQWLREGVAITTFGTGPGYTLTQADVGKEIVVRVSYTDDFGAEETITSAPTSPVQNVNDVPEGDVVITGSAIEDQTLSADISGVSDADGIEASTVTYQWLRDGLAVQGATDQSYDLGQIDARAQMSVRVSYTDTYGADESLTSAETAAVLNVNDAPEGGVVIEGKLRLREVLTANASTLADADGLGSTSYHWLRNGVAIDEATQSTYAVAGLDIGADLTVAVSYTDNFGFDERVVSPVVVPQANAPAVTLNVIDAKSGEDGSQASFTVALESAVKSDVTITFEVSDPTEAVLQISSVTFTSANWDKVQTVTIQGMDDFDDDGDVSYDVTGLLTTTDLDYVRVPVEDLSFLNLDDTEDADVQIYGDNEVNYLQGKNGDDRLYGLGNLDDLRGGRGDDRLYGGYDDDRLYGDLGNDLLYGEQDDDILEGAEGNDELYGGSGADILRGGAGDDILNGETGLDLLIGGVGNDTYYVDRAGDVIQDNGLASDRDTVVVIGSFNYVLGNGLENADLSDESGSADLTGNGLNNELTGNNADNELRGGAGNDTLYSQAGDDTVDGGDGNDLIIGGSGAGNDTYRGGNGVDTVKFTSATAGISVDLIGEAAGSIGQGDPAGIGRDKLFGIENVIGGDYGDFLIGTDGKNELRGQKGNDVIQGRLGDDLLFGGAGFDILEGGKGNDTIEGGDGRDEVRLGNGFDVFNDNAQGDEFGRDTVFGGNGNDTINGGAGYDEFRGEAGNDLIFGGNGFDHLFGGSGADTLYGGKGNDTIEGGDGQDQMTGGAGLDRFVFASGFGNDTIFGFEAADGEKINLTDVAAITGFADLQANHLEDAGGVARIVAGANSILLDGVAFADVGVGFAYSVDDFIF
ncbi:hypothetical protein [Shimia sp.]